MLHFHNVFETPSELQRRCFKWTSIDSICVIPWPNHMFDHLLESSQWDKSNKWLNTGFGKEMGIIEIKICTLSGALTEILTFWRIVKSLIRRRLSRVATDLPTAQYVMAYWFGSGSKMVAKTESHASWAAW